MTGSNDMLQKLFDAMGDCEQYDELYRQNPELAAKIEAERTREYNNAEDRTEAEDAKYIGRVNPHSRVATWNVIKGWAHDINWCLAHGAKEG